jgi:hypothetical protein
MFVGHFAVGFGAKAFAKKLSLGSLFLAAQFVDLLWPILLLLGIEHVRIVPGITKFTPLDFESYPISHSLLLVIGWAILFAVIYWFSKRYIRGSIVLGLCVVSHWFLDLIVHRPDLPLYPGNYPLFGFGLWNYSIGTVFLEGMLFLLGVLFYFRTTKALDKIGIYGFWSLVGILLIIYIGNILGPAPPNAAAIAWAGNTQWLFIFWAYWIDRHRIARDNTASLA